jgi:hypothetical protein
MTKCYPNIRRIFSLLTHVRILLLLQMTMGCGRVTTLTVHVTGLIQQSCRISMCANAVAAHSNIQVPFIVTFVMNVEWNLDSSVPFAK